MERRFLSASPVKIEMRAAEGGEKPALCGYGARFYDPAVAGTEYHLRGYFADFYERIMPGAFDRALADRDDAAGLFNHDPSLVLGRTSSGTMRLSADSTGLRYEIDPPDTAAARDLLELIRRGDVAGSSFSFDLDDEGQIWREELRAGEKVVVREILSVARLYDTGPVTFPAYEATTAGVRSAGDLGEAKAAFERWQRRAAKGPGLGRLLMRQRLAEADG